MAAPRPLSLIDEARNATSKEVPEDQATKSPRKSTTGWQTTALRFGFYVIGRYFIQ
jgi:hypothetical protein